MIWVLILTLFVSLFINKAFNNKNLLNLIFGFVLLEAITKFLPVTYNILSANFHDATFLYVILSMLLGIIMTMLLNSFGVKEENVYNNTIYVLIGFILVHKKIDISLFNYVIFSIIMGVYLCKNKSQIFSLIVCCLLGNVLYIIGNWMIGYILGCLLGVTLLYIKSKFPYIIKNNEKYASIFLLVGMALSFIGVIVK